MTHPDYLTTLEYAIKKAKQIGASDAEGILISGLSTGVGVRHGDIEELEQADSSDLGIRVFVGKQQASVSTSKFDQVAIDEAVERAVLMAKQSPEDPYSRLAKPEEIMVKAIPDLDLYDDHTLDADQLKALALEAESHALNVKGVTNSEGGSAGYSRVEIALATSSGFTGTYKKSSFSVSASVLAGSGTGMERDYDYSSAHHFNDLESAEKIGRTAGEKAVRRLNPKKGKTCKVPIIYDPRIGNSLLGHFSGAINGRAVARGTSFLKNAFEKQVFAPEIQIIDDPLMVRGVKSKAFDAEGLETRKMTMVDNGILRNWFLDIASAEQLKMQSNGHAHRSTNSRPSPGSSNLYIAAGSLSPEELIATIDDGFYVTELIGMGVNGVTGDYSRGAAGFWIEKGEISYPVNEVTITSNLKEMFMNMRAANDLDFKYGANTPTLMIEGMTIAGA